MKRFKFANLTKISLLTLLFVFVAHSCSVNPVTGKKELMLLSEDQERAMGLSSDPGIIASFGLYPDSILQEFINEKGKEMGAISHRPDLEYEFRILDSPVVNAFAVPGGFIYFTRGIMAHFNNEAEFAGVLGHEIGHVTARHSASQYSKQILAQGALLAGIAISEDFRQYAGVAQQGLGLLFLKFGRDDESQSDRLGVEYSTKIGYDAYEMASFFNTLDRLSDQGGQRLPSFLSTHPDPADRYRKVLANAEKWKSSPNVNRNELQVNRDSYLRMIDGLVYGEDPRQGFVENSVFYHPVLKIQFPIPSGWQTVNSPQQVQMAPQDGQALLQLTFAPKPTLEESASAFVTDNQLQLISQNNTTVNGYSALTTMADQVNQQTGQTVRILSYFIQFGDVILQFNGMSLQQSFQNYQNYFLQTIKNFRDLTDPEKINRQPDRIRIKTVPRTNTFQAALTALRVPASRHEEFAILNGMELKDTVEKGMLIKVVGK